MKALVALAVLGDNIRREAQVGCYETQRNEASYSSSKVSRGLPEQSAWLLFTCEWLAHSYLRHEDLHDF